MSNILLDVEYVEGLKKRIANAENTIKHWQSNYRLVTARADELEAERDRLRDIIIKYSHDSRLQTFNDRESFRKEAKQALKEKI